MKTLKQFNFFTILVALSMAITASPLMAQVYKVVDKDGNVTFTDQPPGDGSKPVELAPISIIEAPVYETAPKEGEGKGAEEGEKEMSLSYLRRNYSDFAIVSPQQEESVWRPDGPIPITWNSRYALQDGMQVIIYLDGNRHAATTQQMVPVSEMDRGEHTVTAEIRDSRNRIIANAEPVTFFVRQPGLYNRAVNRGG